MINLYDEAKVRIYVEKVKQFERENYRLDSKEGNELQEMLYDLLDIEDKQLSLGSRRQKKELELLLVNKKLKGLI